MFIELIQPNGQASFVNVNHIIRLEKTTHPLSDTDLINVYITVISLINDQSITIESDVYDSIKKKIHDAINVK